MAEENKQDISTKATSQKDFDKMVTDLKNTTVVNKTIEASKNVNLSESFVPKK